MNDIEKLEQRIDAKFDKLIDTMNKLSETMTTFIGFQSRAEERHINSSILLKKLEAKVDKLWDMVHKNSLVVNGVVAVVTATAIWLIRGSLGG